MAEVTNISPDNKGTDRILRFLKMLSAVPILILFLLFSLPSMIYSVASNEVAVVLRFGKFNRTEGEGAHVKMPWDLESVIKVPVYSDLKMEFGFRTAGAGVRTQYDNTPREDESMMLTGDLNLVEVSWIIQYEIKDAREYLFNVRSIDDNLHDLSISVMREVIGDYPVDVAIGEARDTIGIEAMESMQKILDEYKMGIRLKTIEMQDVILPRTVRPSFDKVSTAGEEAKQIAFLAEQNSKKLTIEESGKASQEVNNAEAYKIEKINNAMGDTQRFVALYEEYKKAPELTKKRLYFEKLMNVLTNANKVYLVDPEVRGILPHLNLNGE